ncbi:MAG: phosphoenolpyruvate synthase [Candidatus Wallbacteria bacterium]|nr:phosphoenolpyruvate synthase [Candidatus Wallbacteria bacterium]
MVSRKDLQLPEPDEGAAHEPPIAAIIGERLTLTAFHQIAGNLAGYPFVKLVVDRPAGVIHFLNSAVYPFHGDYIAGPLLGLPPGEFEANVDTYNASFYKAPDRRHYLAILALHRRETDAFFTLETVEVDTMDGPMLLYLYRFVRDWIDPSLPLLLKPANHLQEAAVAAIDSAELPRIYSHELFASATYIPLNPGRASGRLRAFASEADYRAARSTLDWHDIIVMARVPDDIPRLSGIINAQPTTPLSHTNVLASGWDIPNSVQVGLLERVAQDRLDGQWVDYEVRLQSTEVQLTPIERPASADRPPAWRAQKIRIEEPETGRTPIVQLDQLRMDARHRYGTKAANLGELSHVLRHGSDRLLGFYRIRRPPRPNLLPYLAKLLGVSEDADLARAALDFLRKRVQIPGGIAIPFSLQQEFLESSPKIQQAIGKLKMALELNARQTDALCVNVQRLIRDARIPERIRGYIDTQVANVLGGCSSFVVRSSSNAEDLERFSAAGIYESINHVTRADTLFESIKQVWASLLSPRSVRLRQEVGISLDDSYMGVIVQEEVGSLMGGVLVTSNPTSKDDFRNVYINASTHSVNQVVQGAELPYQYLYNTVEGGGRTLSIGNAEADLPEERKEQLQDLAVAGRLLQSHFSADYTFSSPLDIEWLAAADGLHLLQLRPYAR